MKKNKKRMKVGKDVLRERVKAYAAAARLDKEFRQRLSLENT